MPGETIIRFDGLGVEQDIREPKMKDLNLVPDKSSAHPNEQ